MSTLQPELMERVARLAIAHAPGAFPADALPGATPAKVALNAMLGAVQTYGGITQVPDAAVFMVEKVGRMFQDQTLTGQEYGKLLAAAADDAPGERPFPAVLFAAWVTCAYAIETFRAADRGALNEAWALACEASRTYGFAEGAASELIVRYKHSHSRERMAPANNGRRRVGKLMEQRIQEWACRSKYAGMKKEQAAVEMEADRVGRAAGTVYRKLQELFPGDAWKYRRIDQ